MRKLTAFIFIVAILICACSDRNQSAAQWLKKEQALWDGQKYTDPQKAIEYLDKALKIQSDNYEIYNKKGTAYYNLGQYQKTIEMTSESIRLKPNYFLAYNNRGNAHAHMSQFQKAVENYDQVIRLKPDFVEVYNNRGTVYLLQGDRERGCRDVKKACELGNCRVAEEAKSKGLCP